MTSTCETKKFGTGEVTSCDVFQNAGTEIYLVPTVLLPLARNRLSLNKKKKKSYSCIDLAVQVGLHKWLLLSS